MGFHFLKKSSKNIEMAPRGARSKLLIFHEALEIARAGEGGQLFSSASRLPGETGEGIAHCRNFAQNRLTFFQNYRSKPAKYAENLSIITATISFQLTDQK